MHTACNRIHSASCAIRSSDNIFRAYCYCKNICQINLHTILPSNIWGKLVPSLLGQKENQTESLLCRMDFQWESCIFRVHTRIKHPPQPVFRTNSKCGKGHFPTSASGDLFIYQQFPDRHQPSNNKILCCFRTNSNAQSRSYELAIWVLPYVNYCTTYIFQH